jgi:1-acyl-sn-glycerol-3-phosphate acyltransferase
MGAFRATLVYAFMGIYILLLAPFGLAWSWMSGDCRILYCLARFCIRAAGLICGVRVIQEGRGKIAPGVNYVFLSNHQGNFDGPILCHAIPRDLKALVKKEMMRLPVLSTVLKNVRFVPIERLNPKNAQAAIERGAKLLSEGCSFFAFPEGTRSRDGRLGDFKKGVFIMAIKGQVPVMPVTIIGSAAIQPPGKYSIRPGCIKIVFHDPISTAGMHIEDRHRLVELTREAIASALTQKCEDGSPEPSAR